MTQPRKAFKNSRTERLTSKIIPNNKKKKNDFFFYPHLPLPPLPGKKKPLPFRVKPLPPFLSLPNTQENAGKRKKKIIIIFSCHSFLKSMWRLLIIIIKVLIFFLLQKPLDVTNHSIAREVVTFFTLPPGDYIVVPQTNVPNCDSKFLLRIFTDEQSNIW